MMNKNIAGLTLATAAAALFSSGMVMSGSAFAGDAGTVKCSGINSCKGTAECKTANNECKGQNSCKGEGWVSSESAEACTEAGGSVVES
jgi:hypothetical protein